MSPSFQVVANLLRIPLWRLKLRSRHGILSMDSTTHCELRGLVNTIEWGIPSRDFCRKVSSCSVLKLVLDESDILMGAVLVSEC